MTSEQHESGRPAPNLTWHGGTVTAADREALLGQRGCVLWLTGLSGSGKSTIARALEARLIAAGRLAYVLDGDNVRHGLNAGLGFSPEDRAENIRRLAEVAALFRDAGVIAITAFISPYRADRDRARGIIEGETDANRAAFLEIHVHAPLAECERRDPKHLYAKARAGQIPEFTGVSAPYEPPEHPELVLPTHECRVAECVDRIVATLRERRIVQA